MVSPRPSQVGSTLAGSSIEEGDVLDRYSLAFSELGRIWRSEVERQLKAVGLSIAQWSTLRCLQTEQGCVQKDLARRAGIEEAVLVGVLDRLVSAGYVERREAPHDRRAKTVHLTPDAYRVMAKCDKAMRPMREKLLSDEEAADLERCMALFNRILNRMIDEVAVERDA
ncbi:MAG: MarR family transcriptional regulator [Pseudomonadota bacterium]